LFPKLDGGSQNARQGFFNDEDFNAVATALPGYLSDFARFGYLTGWRKGEIASLRWEDVDDNVIRLRGQNSKNGEGRMVTLDGELAALIGRRKSARHVKTEGASMMAGLVFHNQGHPIGDIRKAWASACVATGRGQFLCRNCNEPVIGPRCEKCNSGARYSGRIFHDFRRTAVRNMVRAGVPERVAMTISGHKTRSIFDRYNIVNEDDLREAMKRTQAYLSAGTDRKGVPQLISAGHERRAQ
jgi:integrase